MKSLIVAIAITHILLLGLAQGAPPVDAATPITAQTAPVPDGVAAGGDLNTAQTFWPFWPVFGVGVGLGYPYGGFGGGYYGGGGFGGYGGGFNFGGGIYG